MAVAIANERISLRTTAEAKRIMEQAARLTGTTLSAFMIQNAYERALDLLAQHRAIQLDAAQWQQLQRLIEAQPAANPWPWEDPWIFADPGETQLRHEQWCSEGLFSQLDHGQFKHLRFAVVPQLLGTVLDNRFDPAQHDAYFKALATRKRP